MESPLSRKQQKIEKYGQAPAKSGMEFISKEVKPLLNDLEAEIKKPMSNQEEMQIFQDFCESELDQQMDTNFS